MVVLTFVVLYALCATVLLLAVAQDRRSEKGRGRPKGESRPGGQRELVFTTQH
jgi:hypothetical protein